jgi:hypothetical protein
MGERNEFDDFMDKLAEFSKKAEARRDQRKSSLYGGALDGTFSDWVLQELVIDAIQRLEKIEKLLFPKE